MYWGPLAGICEASWGLLGASSGPQGVFWGRPGGLLAVLGSVIRGIVWVTLGPRIDMGMLAERLAVFVLPACWSSLEALDWLISAARHRHLQA